MIAICPKCSRRHDLANEASGTALHCGCGRSFLIPEPKPFSPKPIRCGGCGAPVDSAAGRCAFCRSAFQPFDADRFCGECYAYLAREARFCSHCGTAARAGAEGLTAEEVAESGLCCPRDGEALRAVEVGKEGGFGCSRCAGLWVEREFFTEVVTREAQKADAPGRAVPEGAEAAETAGFKGRADIAVRYLECPACRVLMARRNYLKVSGVILDTCPEHGAWLDKGELFALAEFVRRGGLGEARRQELREMEAQQRSRQQTRRWNAEAQAMGVGPEPGRLSITQSAAEGGTLIDLVGALGRLIFD